METYQGTSPDELVDVMESGAALRRGSPRANATGNRMLGEAPAPLSRSARSGADVRVITRTGHGR